MQLWMWAVVPVLIAVAPAKEVAELFRWNTKPWYTFLKWMKAAVMLVAVIVSLLGVRDFLLALYDP